VEVGLGVLHVEVTALNGTPVTVAEKGSVSAVPMEKLDGVIVIVRPETSVTVADAVVVVFCTVATTVIVVLGGIVAGAVYRPVESTVPTVEFPPVTLFTDQVTAFEDPVTVAVNWLPLLSKTVAAVGVTVTETPAFALWHPVAAAAAISAKQSH
jgi:hypothetical protein